MPIWRQSGYVMIAAMLGVGLLAGCGGGQTAIRQPDNQKVTSASADVVRVLSSDYDAKTQVVTLQVGKDGAAVPTTGSSPGIKEDLLDISDGGGVANYATCLYPNQPVKQVRIQVNGTSLPVNPAGSYAASVMTSNQYVTTNQGWVSYHSAPRLNSSVVGRLQLGDRAPLVRKVNRWWYEIRANNRNVYITTNSRLTQVVSGGGTQAQKTVNVPQTITQPVTTSPAPTTSTATRIQLPPPGVQFDTSIQPIAGRFASIQEKTNAVLSVARGKLGTPYIWGHNEDRGQYGFDCSNFTEYVYHHALGYRFTTSSRAQYRSVGVNISKSQIQPGDLLIFNDGGHVGIYAGNNQVIQEGGGLGKVGYLSLAPGRYWANHLSAVRRMY